jgi:hypothetical protein
MRATKAVKEGVWLTDEKNITKKKKKTKKNFFPT